MLIPITSCHVRCPQYQHQLVFWEPRALLLWAVKMAVTTAVTNAFKDNAEEERHGGAFSFA